MSVIWGISVFYSYCVLFPFQAHYFILLGRFYWHTELDFPSVDLLQWRSVRMPRTFPDTTCPLTLSLFPLKLCHYPFGIIRTELIITSFISITTRISELQVILQSQIPINRKLYIPFHPPFPTPTTETFSPKSLKLNVCLYVAVTFLLFCYSFLHSFLK